MICKCHGFVNSCKSWVSYPESDNIELGENVSISPILVEKKTQLFPHDCDASGIPAANKLVRYKMGIVALS